jgi:hypothetical protein
VTELGGYGLTVLGLVGLVVLWRIGPRRFTPAMAVVDERAWTAADAPGLVLWDDDLDGPDGGFDAADGDMQPRGEPPATQAMLFGDDLVPIAHGGPSEPAEAPPVGDLDMGFAPLEADEPAAANVTASDDEAGTVDADHAQIDDDDAPPGGSVSTP